MIKLRFTEEQVTAAATRVPDLLSSLESLRQLHGDVGREEFGQKNLNEYGPSCEVDVAYDLEARARSNANMAELMGVRLGEALKARG